MSAKSLAISFNPLSKRLHVWNDNDTKNKRARKADKSLRRCVNLLTLDCECGVDLCETSVNRNLARKREGDKSSADGGGRQDFGRSADVLATTKADIPKQACDTRNSLENRGSVNGVTTDRL